MGGARVTTLVTLRKCTLGNKREIKTLKFVSASTKGFKGGLAWIKPSKKDMAVTFSYSSRMAFMSSSLILIAMQDLSSSSPCRPNSHEECENGQRPTAGSKRGKLNSGGWMLAESQQ